MAITITLVIAAAIITYLAYYFSNTISRPTVWPELQRITINGDTAILQLQLSNESENAILEPRFELLDKGFALKTDKEHNNVEVINANETVAFTLALKGEKTSSELAMSASRAKLLLSFITCEGEQRFTQFNLKSGMFRETRRKP